MEKKTSVEVIIVTRWLIYNVVLNTFYYMFIAMNNIIIRKSNCQKIWKKNPINTVH